MTTNPRPPLVHYQPIRLFYQVVQIAVLIARLPIWLLCAAVPSLRPVRTWTFRQTVTIKAFRVVLDTLYGKVGVTADRPLDKDRPGELTVVPVTEAAAAKFYTGPLAASTAATPGPVVGNAWLPGPPSTTSTGRQKGGAFVVDSPIAPSTAYTARALLQHARFDAVFVVRYRLAAYGGRNAFPAALQDVLTSYLYLVRTLGLASSSITVSGDSAGGNLALGLLRYIEEFGAALQIPKPGHIFLVAPWVDPCSCFPEPGMMRMERRPNYHTDYLPVTFLQFGAGVYRPAGHDIARVRQNEYFTPLGHPFETTVPIFISIGSVEVLEPDVTTLAAEMKATNGSDSVEVYYEEGAPHDTLLAGESLMFDHSVAQMLSRLGDFIEKTSS